MHGVYKRKQEKLRPDYFVNKYHLDFSFTIMDNYYPIDRYRADVMRKIGIDVYRFEFMGDCIKRYKVRNNHLIDKNKYYGVLKEDWDSFVKSEKSYPFLKLWYEVSSEANDFIMHEMIRKTNLMQSTFNYYYLDETFGMEDNFEERSDKREKKGFPELDFSIKEYSEEIKKYLPILFEEYVNRLYDESVECDEPEDKNYLMLNLAGGVYNRLVRNEIALEEEAKG